GKDFEGILNDAEGLLRELLEINDDYAVIFATGGATNQFSMVPMNLLGKGQTADYIITGSWSKKACAEAKKFGEVHIAASSEDKKFSYIPKQVSLSDKPAYVHFTSNNTIYGSQFRSEPQAGDGMLVCDASSDFLHKKIEIKKYGLIYAGAQKNLGPAGVTLVIIRKDWLERTPQGLPIMMDYNTYVKERSLYNTPPVFAIYAVAEVLKWVKKQGLAVVQKQNEEKAAMLYKTIDESAMYKAVVEPDSRSIMNVVFRLSSEELETKFVKEAAARGFAGLKGHRSVGGIRASIYNAFPIAGVAALVEFMKEFERQNS
ncbi:MAG TPA: 3-phosphoserine/phosphohydroxythreonine transaminase, partial [Oligoflexia bacterium]|nr:3-phosphoserine/phosphohydroxythreonine transaminase [Oligoflexia bacterium]